MRNFRRIAVAGSALALAACATQPVGPMVQVLPAPYKPFEVFQQDHAECLRWADDQTRGQAQQANTRAIGAAVVGTAVGAALGGAIGGGRGAGAGAGIGAAGGAVIGGSQAQETGYGIQQRYDIAYAQCMYSKGNQIPGYGVPPGPPAPPAPPGSQGAPGAPGAFGPPPGPPRSNAPAPPPPPPPR
jgi:hypothetical protein